MRNFPFRQGGRGTRGRIATGAKRPRNDRGGYMGCGTRPGGSSGRPTPTHHSPIELRRGRRPRRPALPWARCGLAMTHYKKCGTNPAGDRKGRPYGGLQEVRGRNPPVTAAPCQPPLGKGDEGTGDADCHGQFENWPRNDRGFCKECGTGIQKQVSRFTHLFFIMFFFKAIPHNWTRAICE